MLVVEGGEGEEAAYNEPVSPTGQYFNSSALSICILVVFESDVPIDDSPTMSTLENLFLPINPRFSSIMVKDENGVQQWKRVKVKLGDHVNVPTFPTGLESYDQCVQDYLSQIALEKLPQSRPLWDLHIIKYPTSNAEGTMVFKLHHALGDGFSLMGALFSCLHRADDPSLPLTFPTPRDKAMKKSLWGSICGVVPRVLSVCANTIRDVGWSLWKSTLAEDDTTPLRSGTPGLEFRPITISCVEFSLDDIRKIKAAVGGTVNDVISGIIFYGTQLYMQRVGEGQRRRAARVTAMVLLNTRIVSSYETVEKMTKTNAKSPWGNQFGFLHVSIPTSKNAEKADPLYFIRKARKIIKAKRSSFAVYLTGRLLEMLRKLKGPEAAALYIHTTLRKSSMTVSNLVGPIEQTIIAGHPVRSFHFMVVGVPQSLTITVISYMGKLKVAMGVEKGFIDSELLISSLKKSFERIFEAAIGQENLNRCF
ncbi:O-acyltransferase WSD1-like [Phoenix dactylifera]|uniref:O-acyltransferase WSD1-like n=1 Tax=Phoenix dactylifera TaxID=42345 RepID=A0A8B7C4U5_PHODC|nr:O-acyltransferase WSD1-like [Phoenix dactylifera]